jgi:hypothetical protein
MDSDFRPVRRPVKSLRASLDERSPVTETKTETFKTPAEIAAEQALSAPVMLDGSSKPPIKPPQGRRINWRWPKDHKEWTAVALSVLLLTTGTFLTIHHRKPVARAKPIKQVVKVSAQPTTVPSALSGLPVDPSLNQKPVTAVMIENSLDARPQSGLSQAGVVFEAIAEGGITRFLALYQDTSPENVGPVRSARPYYVQWEMAFDAPYAHVGGSPESLNDIRDWGVKDLNQFYNGGSYHRIGSRPAPHNVYTSIATLNQLETAKGYTTSTFTGFPRKKEAPTKQAGAKTIDLGLSGPLYNVHYDYNPASNSYNRSEGGAAHTDANGNTQISPKVVVAMVMQYGIQSDGKHSDYNVIGSGQAYVFQDGTVTTGQWTKADNKSQIVLTDGSGKTLKLNPGQTWFTAVSASPKVTYAP